LSAVAVSWAWCTNSDVRIASPAQSGKDLKESYKSRKFETDLLTSSSAPLNFISL